MMAGLERRNLFHWAALVALAILCCSLAVLQYSWIGAISRAEQERLKTGLQSALNRLSDNFDEEIESACFALQPSNAEVDELGRENAYVARYAQWRSSTRHPELFQAVAIAIPRDDSADLEILDRDGKRFIEAAWPASWDNLHRQLQSRLSHGPPGRFGGRPDDSNVFEVPRFGPSRQMGPGAVFGRRGPGEPGRGGPGPGRPRPNGPGPGGPGLGGPGPRPAEQDWLVVELNVDYVSHKFLPALLATHLGGVMEYDAEVYSRSDPSRVIYRSKSDAAHRIGSGADGSVSIFSFRRGPRRPPGPAGADFDGRWQLVVQSHAGSLAALVQRTRIRNLAVSAAILLMLVATVALLLRSSRQAQRLAELQMNFVAGISHEFRTPLTVIRTAAFNLKGKFAANPAQVERYGALIQEESEKLTALVEQVLRFASTRAGRVIAEKTPVFVDDLIEDLLRSRQNVLEGSGFTVEKNIESDLPPVMADEVSLKQAVQNLLDNAVKYGRNGTNWIGISASSVTTEAGLAVDLRVADHGPGIPAEEQAQIFDAFFRGKRAIDDQIHGSGLGLNLVKKIIEAHGGSVRVVSDPSKGTEFVVRIPAAPQEIRNELAHSLG